MNVDLTNSALAKPAGSSEHDKWRRRIAKAATTIIARDGLAAATVRHIAAELGFSTKVVTHYFSDKEEVLLYVYRNLFDRGMRQFNQSVMNDPQDLAGSLFWLTAAHEHGLSCWRISVAIWDRASHDPVFAEEQHRWVTECLRTIANAVSARNSDREDCEEVAQLLSVIVQGISIQILFDPGSWTEPKVRDTLAHQIDLILGKPKVRPRH